MNDLEFVQRCVRGEKAAWDELVDKYSRLIYNYIHSILKLKGVNQFSQDNIRDLFQDIFLLLAQDNFKKLRSFKARNGCSLASWLRRIVINHTIDYIRRTKSNISLDEETDEGFSLKDILTDDSPSIKDTLSEKEKFVSLKDCIQELDIDDKYFVELHINKGLRLQELKEHFRVSRGAIDMRKSRIIDRLRECFKHKGFALDF